MGMVDTITCIAGTKLNIISLLIIRKYSVQMFSQCIQWQTRDSIIITVYFFDQAASYTLKTIPSCFIPEIIFLDSKDKLRNIILTIIITSQLTWDHLFLYILLFVSRTHLQILHSQIHKTWVQLLAFSNTHRYKQRVACLLGLIRIFNYCILFDGTI